MTGFTTSWKKANTLKSSESKKKMASSFTAQNYFSSRNSAKEETKQQIQSCHNCPWRVNIFYRSGNTHFFYMLISIKTHQDLVLVCAMLWDYNVRPSHLLGYIRINWFVTADNLAHGM